MARCVQIRMLTAIVSLPYNSSDCEHGEPNRLLEDGLTISWPHQQDLGQV